LLESVEPSLSSLSLVHVVTRGSFFSLAGFCRERFDKIKSINASYLHLYPSATGLVAALLCSAHSLV
jgi:hypothetical protein